MVDLSETVLWAAKVRAAVEAFRGDDPGPADPDLGMRLVRALAAAEALTTLPPPPEPAMPRAAPFDALHHVAA